MKYVAAELGDTTQELQTTLDQILAKKGGKLINVVWRGYFVVLYEYDDTVVASENRNPL